MTNDAWQAQADNATFMEHSFRWPLTLPTMGWKLKGASRASFSSPAAAVRRRRFRIVLIIVRRPPRGGETVSRGWRPRPWPWCGSAGWRLIERQDFHCSPPPHSLFSLSPSGAATITVAAATPAIPSHSIHATFSPTSHNVELLSLPLLGLHPASSRLSEGESSRRFPCDHFLYYHQQRWLQRGERAKEKKR